jgi:hypothetical protein
MKELSVVIMKRFRSNWFEKTKERHVTYNTRQSVLRRKRIYASFVKSKIHRKEDVKEIPPYFKNQAVPIVSYSYTNSIGRKIFNYKEALQNINIEKCLKNPLTGSLNLGP